MRLDRIKWNAKYRRDCRPADAAGVVKKFYHLAPGKKALDIAAGNGRNAIYLAGKGFSVDAVDISEIGLAEFASRHPEINAVCADLDQFEIAAARYDLIVNVKFLNRRLFPYIQEGLKAGGIVIFQTLLESQKVESKPGHCRDYLLRKNELLHAFLGLRILYYREAQGAETNHHEALATLVGVKS